MSVGRIFETAWTAIKDHSGTICALTAIGGVGATAYFSGKAAVEVDHLVDPDMTFKERAKVYAKAYWKTAVSGFLTCGLIFGSDRLHVRKEIGLAGLAAFWKKQNDGLERKVIDRHGKEELDDIRKELVKEDMEANPIPEELKGVELQEGEFVAYEPYSEQYIVTTEQKITAALLHANEKMQKEYEVFLDSIVIEMGGKSTPVGRSLSWNVDNEVQDYNFGYMEGGWWLRIMPGITHNGVPALLYTVDPSTQPPEEMFYREECP